MNFALPHRNADRGRAERRGIIYAISGHCDEVPFVLQRLHDADLLLGINARVNADSLDMLFELRFGHCGQLAARH
jgi:hypothetical protein